MYDNYSVKCGKLSFPHEQSADRKIEQREFDEPDWKGRSYQCSRCGKWHITTQSKNEFESDGVLNAVRTRKAEHNKTNQRSKNTVEGSRAISSYGVNSSGSSIFDSTDEDTLRKLGLL